MDIYNGVIKHNGVEYSYVFQKKRYIKFFIKTNDGKETLTGKQAALFFQEVKKTFPDKLKEELNELTVHIKVENFVTENMEDGPRSIWFPIVKATNYEAFKAQEDYIKKVGEKLYKDSASFVETLAPFILFIMHHYPKSTIRNFTSPILTVYLRKMVEETSIGTVRKKISFIKKFMVETGRKNVFDKVDTRSLLGSEKATKKSKKEKERIIDPKNPPIPDEVMSKWVKQGEENKEGYTTNEKDRSLDRFLVYRNPCVFAVTAITGAKLEDLANLKVEDVDLTNMKFKLNTTRKMNNQEKEITITYGIPELFQDTFRDYLEVRSQYSDITNNYFFFTMPFKDSSQRRIGPKVVENVLKEYLVDDVPCTKSLLEEQILHKLTFKNKLSLEKIIAYTGSDIKAKEYVDIREGVEFDFSKEDISMMF